MAEAVVAFVVENISDLLNEKAQILNGVSGQVEEVVAKFRWMQSFLPDADARQKEERVGRWIADLRELVYHAEDEIESFVLKLASSLKKGGIKNIIKRYVCVLDDHKIGREMEAIQTRMAELTTRLHEYNIRSSIAPVASSSSSTGRSNETPGKLKRFYSHVVVEPKIVGLQEDVESLVAHLMNESDDECYRVVSICGMGGIGKTTLAQKIYNHSTIKTHFSGLAWVSISQKWESRNVLQRIIFCLVQDPEQRKEIMNLEDNKIMEYLHQLQQSRKCLVVLDDIWSNDAWDCLKAAFPIQHLKSKLMLTSRNVQVSKHVDPKGFLHQPRHLNEQQSWELLQMKALPKENCLDTRSYVKDMEELGREMVGHCAGLPLAIVVLGGILVTKPTLTEWEKVHQEIQLSIRRGKGMGELHQREVLEILVLSYNDLPYQLKPCFLYLSKFGEDVEIKAETLYQLWIAEGLVLSSDRKDDETMMEVAESYLAELVHRCMVQVEFEDYELSLRKFGSCRLHDLMRDLSLSKAKEEYFFRVLDLREGSDYHHDEQSVEYSAYTRRLVIYFDGGESGDMRSTISSRNEAGRSLRSVLWFNVGGWRMERSPPIFRLNQIANFRLLRVLSLEGLLDIDQVDLSFKKVVRGILYSIKLPKVLGTLVHLRYLSLKDTFMLKFPTFIENLEQLQTLDLRVRGGFLHISCSAKHIVPKMEHLRHLYLPRHQYAVDYKGKFKLGFDGLSTLETLESFNTCWCEVKDLQKLNNLRKLIVTTTNNRVKLEEIMQYLESKASSSLRYTALRIILLDEYNLGWGNGPSPLKQLLWSDRYKLNQLRTLGAIGDLMVIDNNSHTATSTLTTLIFERSGLEEDPMPVLEKIPTLRKLWLWDDAFLGRGMVCSAMGFPQLTDLVLYHMSNLEKWRVDRGSMPNLSKLIIWKCVKLEELPEGLKFISALQHLEITSMPKQFCDRIRLVDGEQGPDFYKVAHVPSIDISNVVSD